MGVSKYLSPGYHTRPGRSVKRTGDVNLPDPNKPNVGKAFQRAAEGFKHLRGLTKKASPSKR